jgi:hypothetical protein
MNYVVPDMELVAQDKKWSCWYASGQMLVRWRMRRTRSCEAAHPQAEPPYVSAPYEVMSTEDARDHIARLVGNKVGGSPVLPQQEEFPFPDWRLLLQLEQILLPFVADFAMGCCFVFSNATVSEARLVFQR